MELEHHIHIDEAYNIRDLNMSANFFYICLLTHTLFYMGVCFFLHIGFSLKWQHCVVYSVLAYT